MKILAEDNTEFKTVEECLAYEKNCNQIKRAIKCFDFNADGEIVEQSLEEDFTYILLKDEVVSLKEIRNFLTTAGCGNEEQTRELDSFETVYVFDAVKSKWVKLQEVLDYYKQQVEYITTQFDNIQKHYNITIS